MNVANTRHINRILIEYGDLFPKPMAPSSPIATLSSPNVNKVAVKLLRTLSVAYQKINKSYNYGGHNVGFKYYF